MKIENIPAEIKCKSLKEAKDEINEILTKLESKNFDLSEAASNLYKILRIVKKRGYKKIQINKIPNLGPGIAINDRIKRASKF